VKMRNKYNYVSRLRKRVIMKKHSTVYLSDQFYSRARKSPGWVDSTDQFCYPYFVETSRQNTDPFVRKSLKSWNRKIYEAISGYTKKSSVKSAYNLFQKYCKPIKKRDFSRNPRFERCYKEAIQLARNIFVPGNKLAPYSLQSAGLRIHTDTSAGFSYPGKSKGDVIEDLYEIAYYIQHNVGDNKKVYRTPCKLALRGHLSEVDEMKTRPVWIYPGEITMLEAKFGLPYYEFLESEVPEIHFGPKSMQDLAKMLTKALPLTGSAGEVALDWSTFDQVRSRFLISDAFAIVRDSFDFSLEQWEDGLNQYGEKRTTDRKRVFQWLVDYFIETPLMLPNGKCITKLSGVPSGSFFTQAIDTIINYIVIRTIDLYCNLGAYRFRLLGDDSTFLVPSLKKVNFDEIASLADEYFAFELKVEKTRVSTTCQNRKFLGYQIHSYRLIRASEEWFKMALYTERDVQHLSVSCSRMIAFYMLGGINDLDFSQFFWQYIGHYQHLWNSLELEPTRSILRQFRYVLRQDPEILRVIDPSFIDPGDTPYLFTLGTTPIK